MDESLTYARYLRIAELLGLQNTKSDPSDRDEVLFIIVHQVYELWFKQLLVEADAVIRDLIEGRALAALKSLKRMHTIQRVIIQQIDVLETMTPVDFLEFRNLLGSASGFQSVQFRCVEIASGGGNPKILSYFVEKGDLEEIQKRLRKPTMFDALLSFLWRQGYPIDNRFLVPGATRGSNRKIDSSIVSVFKNVYQNNSRGGAFYEAYLLLEHFVEYDELWSLWRNRHLQMVERTIGTKRGTGGSNGTAYLASTLSSRFFPELWDVRREL